MPEGDGEAPRSSIRVGARPGRRAPNWWMATSRSRSYREPWTVRLARWRRRHRTLVTMTLSLLTAVDALSASVTLIGREQVLTGASRSPWRNCATGPIQNLKLAQQAVDQIITRIAEDERLEQSDFSDLRKTLLLGAPPYRYYEAVCASKGNDASLEAERGHAHRRLAELQLLLYELSRAARARGWMHFASDLSSPDG